MPKSHAVAWGASSPSPAQLKELFAQIEAGRITKANLQFLLHECPDTHTNLVPRGHFQLVWTITCKAFERMVKRAASYFVHALLNEILLVSAHQGWTGNDVVADGKFGTCLLNATLAWCLARFVHAPEGLCPLASTLALVGSVLWIKFGMTIYEKKCGEHLYWLSDDNPGY